MGKYEVNYFKLKKKRSKPLIIAAHFREAKDFIKNDRLVSKVRPGYYNGEEYDLFVAGSGTDQILLKLTSLLSQLKFVYPDLMPSHLVNVGVAASFNQNGLPQNDLPLRTIVMVAVSYGFKDNLPQFKSYKTLLPDEVIQKKADYVVSDCVTVSKRINSLEVLNELELLFPQARVLDQELWGLFQVADHFDLPLSAWKIISDDAREGIKKNEKKLIQEIRGDDDLFHYFWKFMKTQISRNKLIEIPSHEIYPWERESSEFYFTFQQKIILSQWIKKLEQQYSSREEVLKAIFWDNLEKQFFLKKYTPKQKAQQLMKQFEKFFSDYFYSFELAMKKLLREKNHELKGIKIDYDPTLENHRLKISFEADSEEQFLKKITQLHQLGNLENREWLVRLYRLYSGKEEI